jgi:hypothetical protein
MTKVKRTKPVGHRGAPARTKPVRARAIRPPVPAINTDVGSDDSDVEDDDEEVLGEFLAGRLENSTRINYASGVRSVIRLLNSCGHNGADAISNGELVIPMSLGVWRAWLAEAKKPIDNNGRLRAPSTVLGFINAVKNAYTEKNQRLTEEVCMLIHKYEEAYKRNVSKLRQKGIMAATEGKHFFSLAVYTKLCNLALYSAETRSNYARFVHTYMIFCWNLFQR